MDGACDDWRTDGSTVGIMYIPDEVGVKDMPSSPCNTRYSGGYNSYMDDDGVTALPTTYPRMKEGISRFYITDINNPASGSAAESTLVVMFDAYGSAGSLTEYYKENGVLLYNHVPGGSNVLYMDGHVEFVRYMSKFPLGSKDDTAIEARAKDLGWAMGDMAGQG